MTAPARDVQGSMFPDRAPERPQGWIMPSVFRGTNAELMAAVAPMYLDGSVLDVTYGNGDTAGGWWRNFTPAPFTYHDLALDGVDFRQLPEADASIDTVCFDPPYVPQGGTSSERLDEAFRGRFGLVNESTPWWSTRDLLKEGLRECGRVARSFVLAKCSDFVSGGKFHLGHRWMLDAADNTGWTCHDLIVHHTGSGPGGHNIYTPIRARRHHSYLLVFAKAAS